MRLLAASLASLLTVSACAPSSSIGYLSPPVATDERTGLGTLDTRLAMALRSHRTERAAPPFSLAPSDGSELALRALDAKVHIDGPLARTELHLVFHNTEARQREGRFAITLPPGATVSRFAMKVGSEWREARIVARSEGRRVYETFLKRGVDPALLEQDVANQFSARVFPIDANADKEIVLAYDHGVAADAPYTLALAGLPPVPSARVTIAHDGTERTIEGRGQALADVIEPIAAGASAVASNAAFVARIEAPQGSEPAPIDSLLVLVDTSASRVPVMAAQARLVRDLLARLPGRTPVRVAAFDQRVTTLYSGAAEGTRDIADRILDHGALGASDLGGALAHARTAGAHRVVLVGDGTPTLGETDAAALAATLAGSGVRRIDAVQVGASLDHDTLAAIVATGTQPGAILDGHDAARLAASLQVGLPPERAIRVDGATATWPATTRGLAPGAPIWVYGLRDDGGDVTIHVGDRDLTVRPAALDAQRVRRTVAGAELAALTERMQAAPEAERAELGTQIEQLALAHQLVSARTSFIVLESDALEERMLGDKRAPAPSTPSIDPTSTTQGITIDRNYVRNIPVPGRTFDTTLGGAAGSQGDGLGVSFSGASSLENEYYVDGVNTGGEVMLIRDDSGDPRMKPRGQFAVTADVLSPLALDLVGESLWSGVGRRAPTHEPAGPAEPVYTAPYAGALRDTFTALKARRTDDALATASRAYLAAPGDVAAIISLGEALEARGAGELAARAYGSLVDLYPARADLARAAGERLDRLAGARTLAIDAYRRALRERPDQATTYRLLAFALVRAGKADEARALLAQGRERAGDDRIKRVFDDDATAIAARPGKPSIRFVLTWETDANDVDLHVFDTHGGHAFYQHPELPSGGALIGDITTGYGPEEVVIDEPDAFPYRLGTHYYRKGPMGVGLGTVQIIRDDGRGHVTVEDRPFVIQNDNAMVDLGQVTR